MNILYIGNESGTSLQRINAFKRLGHEITVINPEDYAFVSKAILYKWQFETGGFMLVAFLSFRVFMAVRGLNSDLVWVNGGDMTSPWLIKQLKRKFGVVINYNNDLPFGGRDKLRWSKYMASVPFYDLLLVRSNTELSKPLALGAKMAVAMYMLADEVVHKKQPLPEEDARSWQSDVLFVGTWFPERGGFIVELITAGVPLAIYGDRWQKAPEWELIKPFWKGASLNGLEYTYALQNAKICLGLVSEENNDLHTSRSMEVPAVGSLLCAKRTYEHQLMYKEGAEAVFWDNGQECSAICQKLLKEPAALTEIAKQGHQKFLENNFTNEAFIAGVLGYISNERA